MLNNSRKTVKPMADNIKCVDQIRCRLSKLAERIDDAEDGINESLDSLDMDWGDLVCRIDSLEKRVEQLCSEVGAPYGSST